MNIDTDVKRLLTICPQTYVVVGRRTSERSEAGPADSAASGPREAAGGAAAAAETDKDRKQQSLTDNSHSATVVPCQFNILRVLYSGHSKEICMLACIRCCERMCFMRRG